MGNSMNGCLRAAGMAENMPPRDMLDMPDEIDFPTDDGVAEVPDLPDVQELPAGISSTADATVNKVDTEPTAVVAAEIYSPLGPTENRTLLVLNGPSGVGKGTLINKLREEYPQKFGFSVSHTTRQPRKGEVNGKDYHFVTHEMMEALIAENEFFEYARVHGNIYGTSKTAVQSVTQTEKICILDIDVQGAQNVRRSSVAEDALYVFIKAPSMEVLEARLRGRGTETEDKVLMRLANAKTEMDFSETPGFYHQIIVNDNLEVAYQGLCAILGLASDIDDATAQEEAQEEIQEAASPVSPVAEPMSPGPQNLDNINDFVPEEDAPPMDDDEIVRQSELRAAEATAREREMRQSRENAEQEEMAAQAAAQQAAIAAAIAEATANMQGALAAQEAEKQVEEEKQDEVPPAEATEAVEAEGVVLEEHHEHEEHHAHHEEVEVDALTAFLNGLHSEGFFDEEELFQIMDDICDAPSPEESQAGKAFAVFHNNPKMFVRKVRSFLNKGGKKAD